MIMEDREITDTQNKAIRLFTYLEKALALDDKVVRDFRTTVTAPSPWWLGDLPHDVENLNIKSFETEKKASTDSSNHTGSWLCVEKKNINPPSPPPKELEGWIDEISPLDTPKPKEKIDRIVQFNQDKNRVQKFKDFRKEFHQRYEVPNDLKEWVVLSPDALPEVISTRYIGDYWIDHPELQSLLEEYIENDWLPWSEKVKKIYKANMLYDELYALRLLFKNEGDNFELLWGHGLLTWKHSQVGIIYAPIFLTPLILNFDPSKRSIEISPDPMFRSFVDISSLHNMQNPAEIDLITWADQINVNPFYFWHLETLKLQCRTLINYLSNENDDQFENNITAAPDISTILSISNAPVIFARKRTNDLWSKYAAFIRKDIEKNNTEPTEFISDLIGDYQEIKSGNTGNAAEMRENSIKEAELFFPLPWNEEQNELLNVSTYIME